PYRCTGYRCRRLVGRTLSGLQSRHDRGAPDLGHVVSSSAGGEQARNTAAADARRSYGKLVAFLAARTRDVASVEDALSEAFASALSDWPINGCPANPEGWLLTAARRKLIDFARRRRTGAMA